MTGLPSLSCQQQWPHVFCQNCWPQKNTGFEGTHTPVLSSMICWPTPTTSLHLPLSALCFLRGTLPQIFLIRVVSILGVGAFPEDRLSSLAMVLAQIPPAARPEDSKPHASQGCGDWMVLCCPWQPILRLVLPLACFLVFENYYIFCSFVFCFIEVSLTDKDCIYLRHTLWCFNTNVYS